MAPAHHQNQQLLLSTTSPSNPSSPRTGGLCREPAARPLASSSSSVATTQTMPSAVPATRAASSPDQCFLPPSSSLSSPSSSPSCPTISKSACPSHSPVREPGTVSVLAAVQAQVMSRSEKFGGWLPHSGGGMSNVMLIKRTSDRTGSRSASSASSASSEASVTTGYRSAESHSVASHESAATSTTASPIPPSSSSSSPVTASPATCDFEEQPAAAEEEFQIIATRISDENVVLDCLIKKDIVYNNVMPTFHHWITGNSKFGLTFETSSEGRRFSQAIRRIMQGVLADESLRS